MAVDEYWLSAHYAHQGQEKPDQPDNSWDPVNFGGETPWWTWPEYSGGGFPGFDLGTPGPSCSIGSYASPGDKYYMPVPAFYPGEHSDNGYLDCTGEEGAYFALVAAGDGTTYTHADGASFIVAGTPDWYWNFTPRPVVSRGAFTFRVRGTGTLTVQVGIDVPQDWAWYDGDESNVMWWNSSVLSVGPDWSEVGIWMNPDMLAPAFMENSAFLAKVTVSGGSVEFDYGAWMVAGDCGFHRLTGETTLSPWFDQEQWTAPQAANTAEYRAAYVIPDSLTTCGTASEPPVEEPRAITQGAHDLLNSALPLGAEFGDTVPYTAPDSDTDITDASAYTLYTHYTAATGGSASLSPTSRLNAFVNTAKWGFDEWWEGYPPYGWLPRDAAWYWGQNATPAINDPWTSTSSSSEEAIFRRLRRQGKYISYAAWRIKKPNIPPGLVAAKAAGMIPKMHMVGQGQALYEEGVDPTFMWWEISPQLYYNGFPDQTYSPHVIYTAGDTSGDQSLVQYHTPFTAVVELNTDWVPGTPLPTLGSGVQLGSFDFPAAPAPGASAMALDFPENLTSPNLTLSVYQVSGYARLDAWVDLKPHVLLPRYRINLVEWEYLGG